MAAAARAACSAALALLLATGAVGSSHGCAYDFEILKVGSRLNLKGDLNGHPLHMKHSGDRPTPSGILALTLSKCPHGGIDLVTLQHFEYTFHSKGTLSVHPLSNVEVCAAACALAARARARARAHGSRGARLARSQVKAGPVTVHVSGLQLGLNGTQVVQVQGSYFNTVLNMEVRSGIGSALGHSYDLSGSTAKVPMKGYFAYDGLSGDITFHVYDFSAPFIIDLPEVHGQFTVYGSLTALHLGDGVQLGAEPAAAAQPGALGGGRGRARGSGLGTMAALGALCAAAVVGVSALVARAARHVRLARHQPALEPAAPVGAARSRALLPGAVPRSDAAADEAGAAGGAGPASTPAGAAGGGADVAAGGEGGGQR